MATTNDAAINVLKNKVSTAKKQLLYARKFVSVADKFYKEAEKLLVKTPVTSVQVISGDLYYTLGDSKLNGSVIPFPTTSESLNKLHWAKGITGYSGVFDSDVVDAHVSGQPDYSRIKFDQSRTPSNVALIDLIAAPGVLLSNQSNPKDRTFPISKWNEALKAAGTTAKAGKIKQVYDAASGSYYDALEPQDMPGEGIIGNQEVPPCTFGVILITDDVDWAKRLWDYYLLCKKYRTKKQTAYNNALTALNDAEKARGIPLTTPIADGSNTGGGTNDDKKDDPTNDKGSLGVGDDTQPVIYNLPGAKEVYFQDNNPATYVTNGNKPHLVKEAKELWAGAQPYKGMIQSYIVPGKLAKNGNWFSPKDVLEGDLRNINSRRYGFQFLYNPSTVSMHYAGAPQVDIGLQTSGADKVPLIGSGVTSSSVTFQLLLNRMQDMKYIDAIQVNGNSQTNRKSGYFVNTPDSTVRTWVPANNTPPRGVDFKQIYSHSANHPDVADDGTGVTNVWEEVRKIKELGTMYDVEYLLRTLLGYELKSGMRNRYTADIGYLGAYPVELHLGKNMRYLVTIDSFEISHTIFTQDMIPVFTNLQITCNRLPDFAKRFNEVEVTKTKTDEK